MRLCVIGNSHLAAMKLGWDVLKSSGDRLASDLQPVFFGAPRDRVRMTKVENGCVIPTRDDIAADFERISGGQRMIRLADYDAVVLVGLNVNNKRLLRFYKTHIWHGLAPDPDKTMVPRQFVADFLTERFRETLLAEMAVKIAAATTVPILGLAEPYWASDARYGGDHHADYGWDKAILAGDGPMLDDTFKAIVQAALTPQAIYVPQPTETIEGGVLTKAAYNKNASRLISGEGGGTDPAHMNAAFGQVMWPLVRQAVLDQRAQAAA